MESFDGELRARIDRDVWLKPEALIDFFYELQQQGFKLGIQQYLDLEKVMAALALRKSFPASVEDLSSWLGPVACSTPEEQNQFHAQFRSWLDRRKDIPVPEEPESSKISEVQTQKPTV